MQGHIGQTFIHVKRKIPLQRVPVVFSDRYPARWHVLHEEVNGPGRAFCRTSPRRESPFPFFVVYATTKRHDHGGIAYFVSGGGTAHAYPIERAPVDLSFSARSGRPASNDSHDEPHRPQLRQSCLDAARRCEDHGSGGSGHDSLSFFVCWHGNRGLRDGKFAAAPSGYFHIYRLVWTSGFWTEY